MAEDKGEDARTEGRSSKSKEREREGGKHENPWGNRKESYFCGTESRPFVQPPEIK